MKKIAQLAAVVSVAAAATLGGLGTASAQEISGLTPAQQQQFLNKTNQYRSEVGNPSLQWSDSLASSAQAWANQVWSTHAYPPGHSSTANGENIYAGWSTGSSPDPTQALGSWYSEKSQYQAGQPATGATAGHYTQMVSKSVQSMGCGAAGGPYNGRNYTYVVCQYQPQGNNGTVPFGSGS